MLIKDDILRNHLKKEMAVEKKTTYA